MPSIPGRMSLQVSKEPSLATGLSTPDSFKHTHAATASVPVMTACRMGRNDQA